jgi:hypothetical protein
MGIEIRQLGSNSFEFSFSTNVADSELLEALTNRIDGTNGWILHDASPGGTGTAKCFKALNKDGTTYKFVILRLISGTLSTEVYETWNAATHTGTNLTAYSNGYGTYIQWLGFSTLAMPVRLFLFINPRWLAVHSVWPFTGARSYFNGCFEFSRDNAGDTVSANYPCFCFFHSDVPRGLPRDSGNNTGGNALIDVITMYAPDAPTYYNAPSVANPWSGKHWAPSLYVRERRRVLRGRLYGLRAFTNYAGLLLDRAMLAVDSDYLEIGGSERSHLILPIGNLRFLVPL